MQETIFFMLMTRIRNIYKAQPGAKILLFLFISKFLFLLLIEC